VSGRLKDHFVAICWKSPAEVGPLMSAVSAQRSGSEPISSGGARDGNFAAQVRQAFKILRRPACLKEHCLDDSFDFRYYASNAPSAPDQ
jgi:hypothetical protein